MQIMIRKTWIIHRARPPVFPAKAVYIAKRSGGGILLDSLHFQRYGGQFEQLWSLDRDLLTFVQLCDAPLAPPSEVPQPASLPPGQSTDGTDLQLESRAMRLLPGDGELPLRAFLAALPAGIPISVEAPVLSLQGTLTPVEFARRAREAVVSVVPESGRYLTDR
jgi:sugar phosphate isomerase/epimerase